MTRALFAKAVCDARVLFLSLLALMFLFPWVFIWMSSKVSLPAFSEFLATAIPQKWQQLSGVPFSEIATPAGRVALVYAHPLIMLGATVWAIARGSDCVSGEIGRGTMEMLLAQPVRRITIYSTQAAATILGSGLLATAAWCGTAIGLRELPPLDHVSAGLFIPPALSLFAFMVCIGGISAFVSSWDSQRWRTVGLIGAWYVFSTVLEVVGSIASGWQWLNYLSFKCGYEPQVPVAHPAEAWSVLLYQDGAVAGIGSAGRVLVLLAVGVIGYVAGAFVFTRREIPAPL